MFCCCCNWEKYKNNEINVYGFFLKQKTHWTILCMHSCHETVWDILYV